MDDKIKPPLVSYEIRAVENRAKTIAEGHLVCDDVDYVKVQQVGARDTTEKPYADWIELQRQHVREGRIPGEWLEKFELGYERWKRNEEMPEDGMPIKNWCVPTPGQVKVLLGLGIRTVEAMASANTEAIGRIGMGGLTLKNQAQAFLDEANSTGKLTGRLNEAETRAKVAEERNKVLEQQVAELKAAVEAIAAGQTPKQFAI